MVFSSIPFLYYFLPITFFCYWIVPKRMKNTILLISSIVFYFYGEPRYCFLLLFSCIWNYWIGKRIEKNRSTKKGKYLLILSLLVDFGLLFYFKYSHFFLDTINQILGTNLYLWEIVLPIGISFYTFQAASYCIDIYRGEVKSADSVWTFATYLTLFPQLIAGPIVRYETVEKELKNRKVTYEMFADGVRRFVYGLSKKVLLANVLGEFSKSLAGIEVESVLSYWLRAIADTFQIYFDFSGYSDMAIGLGLMFGFKFLENFRYPLVAASITDFWRRWHISLSSWLRDYLYIPLGGSRKGRFRQYRNILIVWFATGLWHGASWNFILWGLYFGVLLILEKQFFLPFLQKHSKIGRFSTFFLVVVSFVLFQQTSFQAIQEFLASMFFQNNLPISSIETWYYFRNYIGVLLFAIVFATPIAPYCKEKYFASKRGKQLLSILEPIAIIVLLFLSTAFLVDESFNPFLYFRF